MPRIITELQSTGRQPFMEEKVGSGWRSERVDDAFPEIFFRSSANMKWAQEAAGLSRLVFDALQSECQPLNEEGFDSLRSKGLEPFALIAGNVARSWCVPSRNTFNVSTLLGVRRAAGETRDAKVASPAAQDSLWSIINAPLDLDVKVMMDQEHFSTLADRLESRIDESIGMVAGKERQVTEEGVIEWSYYLVKPIDPGFPTAKVTIKSIKLDSGKTIISVVMDEQPINEKRASDIASLYRWPLSFSIQITNYASQAEMGQDYRIGDHFSGKQNVAVYLAYDFTKDPDTFYRFLAPAEYAAELKASWDQPEQIRAPSYVSLDQAMIAGLRMMNDKGRLWPPRRQDTIFDFFTEDTIWAYRWQLNNRRQEFLEDGKPVSDKRAKEIQQGLMTMLFHDWQMSVRLGMALGIWEVFIPGIERYYPCPDNEELVHKWLLEEKNARLVTCERTKWPFHETALFFEREYTASLPETGPMEFLRRVQQLGFFTDFPLSIDTVLYITDINRLIN
jgi:hypothetical protein